MNLQALDFFMLRRPMLSADLLFNFHLKVTASPKSFEKELICLFSQPLLQEAIYLASPALHAALLSLPEHGVGKHRGKILTKLYKYLVRMCTRATPYGLFAGFTMGHFGDNTSVRFDQQLSFKRFTRVDMAVAGLLADHIKKKKHICEQSLFFPSSSLYKIGSAARFVERIESQTGIENLLSATPYDAMLERIMTGCTKGATLDQMVVMLSDLSTKQYAKQYVLALIQMQILVCELEINITGEPYLDVLAAKLKKMKATRRQTAYLKQIRSLTHAPIHSQHAHKQWTDLLLKAGIKLDNRVPIQTDVRFNTLDCKINRQTINLLTGEFGSICGLYHADIQNTDLSKFKNDFFKRYENKELPLLEVLDCESGIGYGRLVPGNSERLELVENLCFIDPQQSMAQPTALSRLKEKLAGRAAAEALRSVTVTEQELAALQKEQGAIKQTTELDVYWLGIFITQSAQALDSGNFQFLLKNIGGASGLELMGRFCHADAKLTALVQTAAAAQQDRCPGVIFAEIAHLPDCRTANILARPHLRPYEIIYLAKGTLPLHQQIQANDLMIRLHGGEIIITSKRLNRRIIPCMATAHNFTQGLPVYKFLGDLARAQNPPYADWHWGALDQQPFLPRVEYKHFVISRAVWNIEKNRFPALFEKKGNFPTAWTQAALALCIPRYFQISQGDQELLIDSHCPFSLEVLREAFTQRPRVRLLEWLQHSGPGLIEHQTQHYTHEIVIPFAPLAKASCQPLPSLSTSAVSKEVLVNFAAGSPWLYVKIYCGTTTADNILADLIQDFCGSLISSALIEKWFFVRYQDPLPHIRLRFFHSARPGFWHVVLSGLSSLLAPMIEQGIVTSLQTDIYKREAERYAGLAFTAVESVFYYDSRAAVQVLSQLPALDATQTARWLTALYGADHLMDALGLTLEQKMSTVEKLYDQFFTEFKGDKDLTIQLNDQYRGHKAMIGLFMQEPWPGCAQIFTQRSHRIQKVLSLGQPLSQTHGCELASSFVHLFFNRLLSSDHRRQELVLYHYLNKYYNSLINNNKKYKPKQKNRK